MARSKISEFWITNLSKKGITLHDLNVTIMPKQSMNLFDSKHFNLTKEQILLSAKSGSIYQKGRYVVVRNLAPERQKVIRIEANKEPLFGARKNAVDVKEVHYEELDVPDEFIDD